MTSDRLQSALIFKLPDASLKVTECMNEQISWHWNTHTCGFL